MKVISLLFNAIKQRKLKRNSDEHLAANALIDSVSFRLTQTSNFQIIIFLRVAKKAIFQLYSKNIFIDTNRQSELALLTGRLADSDLRINYVKAILKKDVKLVFSKEQLLIRNGFFHDLKVIASVLFILSFVLITRKRKKEVLNYGLLISEIPEIICLVAQLKKYKIRDFVDFENYQVDSNFLYLVLRNLGITVYKVPSPGPLFTHNEILLCDYLCLSSGYQIEELALFKNSIRYKFLIKAMPELAAEYIENYVDLNTNKLIDKVNNQSSKSIGYYSHASWLRVKKKEADNKLNLDSAEERTLFLIKDFLDKNNTYDLIIFTHPSERNEKYIEETKAYYNTIFNGIQFQFAPFNVKSTLSFNYVNIGIVALSTILFERLFVGSKVLICKAEINNFPNPDSPLQNISFESLPILEKLIKENADLDTNTFFSKHKLNHYLYTNFNNSMHSASQ